MRSSWKERTSVPEPGNSGKESRSDKRNELVTGHWPTASHGFVASRSPHLSSPSNFSSRVARKRCFLVGVLFYKFFLFAVDWSSVGRYEDSRVAARRRDVCTKFASRWRGRWDLLCDHHRSDGRSCICFKVGMFKWILGGGKKKRELFIFSMPSCVGIIFHLKLF